ncbi:MAG: CheR family methyltransferase [Chloroflexota bacterium]
MPKRDSKATNGATPRDPGGYLVVIGSSAGGIDALSVLVSNLAPSFPAPVLIAQHLDPRRASHLREILTRRTTLPVVMVEDGSPLTPGSIFVVPANRHIEVTDHEVRLIEPPPDDRPMPSIDLVMATAAEAFGEQLIAVILTGSGSDGAEGARQVKAAGGTVVIQDPRSAQFPSMPNSLAPTNVDIVADVAAIGGILESLVTGTAEPSRPDEERLLARFLDEVREQTGIDFSTYKRPTILRRLQRRMVATNANRLADYIRYVGKHPEEYQRLASSFLIKVTEFFRDPELFGRLRESILPEIVKRRRAQSRELRLWSAGCATGEEAYSIAILAYEALGNEIADWTVRVFATDLDGEAVAFARRGIYPAAALDALPPELVERHFHKLDGEYEVRSHIRALVVFGQHDLAVRAPFPRIDLILCRNVLIYFTGELQRRALELFAFSLVDGGSLILGKAETTSPLPELFAVEDQRLKVFRRRGDRRVVPPFRLQDPATNAIMAGRRSRTPARLQLPAVDPEPQSRAGAKSERILAGLPIGIVIVNRSYDIESINPRARALLGIHGSAIGQDLIHVASGVPAKELRHAIDDALAGRTAALTVELSGRPDGAAVWLDIECYPGASDAGPKAGAVVAVRDVSGQHARVEESDAAAAAARDDAARGVTQIDSLRDANRRLAVANDELASTNAELRSANDELQVANEEVQAATEEVETLNEELQATNEELETLNEELQATVEELSTTNDDMQARTVELQELTVDLEAQRRTADTERARMQTLIESLRDGVLVVDSAGHTILRNQAFVRMFEVEQIQPVDPDGNPVAIGDLRRRAAGGETFGYTFSAREADGGERWYEAYGRPVPASMSIGAGGMLIIHDTTETSLRRLQEEFVGIVAHELRTPLTALRGYLQMLNRHVIEPGERPMLPLAIEQADRLHHLVDELFDVTLAGRGGLTVHAAPVPLAEVIRDTVEIAQGLSDRQRLRVEEVDKGIVVFADRARLQQVLLNLLSNALVHAADSPEVIVRLRRLRRRAEVEIEDHGPGIPRELQTKLFRRFERTSAARRGLGLGLYISREIVAAHGGTIDVDSEPGEGTIFTIRLPLAAGAGSKPGAASDGHGTVASRDGSDGVDETNGSDGADGHDGSGNGSADGAGRPAKTQRTPARRGRSGPE